MPPLRGLVPKGVAVSADGLKLYVANGGSTALAVLDTVSQTLSSSIALPTDPSDVVAGNTPSLLYKNPHGGLGSNGQDLALSHDGIFASYAVGGGNGPGYSIYKLDTTNLSSLGEFVTGAYPRQITFGHDDKTAYAVNQSGAIKVFDTATFLLTTTMTKFVCINKSTGERVKLYGQGSDTSWDCEAAGLVVNSGDSIRMNVGGKAE